jgi:hypothetical protein
METEIVENGHVQESASPFSLRLQAGQLRRLSRMGAGVEGATEVAQAAIAAHNQRRQAYQQAFEAACEDVGIQIPAGEHDVQIDWSTGEVRFVPRQ